uniref:Fe2OG dioxygenase domain-containing protein n=1 Tax=Aureoumbra lagunensis TaxID=44058 RepID=A0A7S3K3H4_9STRA
MERLVRALRKVYVKCDKEHLTRQLLFRLALSELSLGEFATNTTSMRLFLGKALKCCWSEGNGPSFVNATSSCQYPETAFVDEREPQNTNIHAVRTISVNEQTYALSQLQSHGFALLPQVLSSSAIAQVAQTLNTAEHSSPILLRPSTGNGKNGAYSYFVPPPCSPLLQLRESLVKIFDLDHALCTESRFLALRYGENGENYLHQDQSIIPLQAIVLISQPKRDFNGGHLFLRKIKDEISEISQDCFQDNFAQCSDAGDVVVFQARSNYFHGVTRVTHGSAEQCQRFAVGLFQPPARKGASSYVKKKSKIMSSTSTSRKRLHDELE